MKVKVLLSAIFPMLAHLTSVAQLDTSAVKTEKIIEQVVEGKTAQMDQDNVDYLSEVTKYGFKNLFRNYTYNPTIPYSEQINPYAENYMQGYLRTHTAYLQRIQKNATPYFNLIDGILAQYGLPHELKYLAVIESELKSNALSHMGARGPWQFMDYTARDFGLKVNAEIDERTDYTKSTHAAARYLLRLYKDLNDWLLVIAAYNGGPGRVYNAIKKSGSRNFWKLQYHLPEESRNHVKKFIATHFIMENGNAGAVALFGQGPEPQVPDSLKNTLVVTTISGRYDPAVIAEAVDLSMMDFQALNPNMKEVLSTGEEFSLRLPDEKMRLFEERRLEILNKSVDALLNGVILDSRREFGKKTGGK